MPLVERGARLSKKSETLQFTRRHVPPFREIKELLLNLRNRNRPTELEKSVHFFKERIKMKNHVSEC